MSCSVDGCEKQPSARGWCPMHYGRWFSPRSTELRERAEMAQTVGNAIRIDGLKELQKALKGLDNKAIRKEFNQEMRKVAGKVVADVRSQVPVKTGAARKSVKPSFSGGWLAIRAGGPSVPYYPWLDFGGSGVVGWKPVPGRGGHGRFKKKDKRPFISEGRWIYPTIASHRPSVYRAALAAVNNAKRAAGL